MDWLKSDFCWALALLLASPLAATQLADLSFDLLDTAWDLTNKDSSLQLKIRLPGSSLQALEEEDYVGDSLYRYERLRRQTTVLSSVESHVNLA